jgi:outer membrane protein
MTFSSERAMLASRLEGGRWLTLVLVLVLALPGVLQAQQTGGKIGYLNTRAVLQVTPGYAQAESTFTKEREAARVELDKLQNELDSAAADFDQKSVMLSPSARTSRRKELEEQRNRLEQRASELQDRLGQRERELLEPIQSRINQIIDGIRAEGNYAVIFDVSANNGIIVSADKSLDLTDRVIERIKAGP